MPSVTTLLTWLLELSTKNEELAKLALEIELLRSENEELKRVIQSQL